MISQLIIILYTFEVYGKNKMINQIAGIKDSFVVSDELLTGIKIKSQFGFLAFYFENNLSLHNLNFVCQNILAIFTFDINIYYR